MPQSKKPRKKQRASHQHDWQRLANRREGGHQLYQCVSCPETTTNPTSFGRLNVPVPDSVRAMLNNLTVR